MNAVLVDSSAWVEYFGVPRGGAGDIVEELIISGIICTTGVVIAELVSGAGSARGKKILENLLGDLPFLNVSEHIWWRAGEYRYKMKRAGFTAGLPDSVIAATAVNYGVEVFTLDRHFLKIAEHVPLKLFGM